MKIKQAPILPGQPPSVPPAYFQSLSLKNVKCFKQSTVLNFMRGDNVARWTVILGENGIGKTTVLQCLAGLCARPSSIKQGELDRPVISQVMADTSWFTWHESSQRRNNAHTHSVECQVLTGTTLDAFERDDVKVLPWKLDVTIEAKEQTTFTIASPAAEPNLMAGLQCYAYGAGRRMARTSRTSQPQNPRDAIYSLFTDDIALPNAEEWLLELDHAAKTTHTLQKKSQKQFEEVKEMLISILPHVDDLRIEVLRRGSGSTVRVEFKTPYGWVGSNQLSFGYQTIVAWIVDFAKRLYLRYPESSNPIGEPAIVLIDELDLHLHPKWQREIMEYLSAKFTNTQFIVTAHSPLIVQSNPEANIILLERDGDHIHVNQDLDMIKNWRIDQILTSDIFKLESASPRGLQKTIAERSRLLAKSKLSKEDRSRLQELNQIIHAVPSAETEVEREAEAIINSAAKYLKTVLP